MNFERIAFLRAEMTTARIYTERLLDATPPELWFRFAPGDVTHIAWQVGHLAMADFRLSLERLRGPQPADAELISPDFLSRFARLSGPAANPETYPAADELRSVFRRVRTAADAFLATYPDADLDLPPHKPHPTATTRGECLSWCIRHESVHAGQIGLLRRLHGLPPVW